MRAPFPDDPAVPWTHRRTSLFAPWVAGALVLWLLAVAPHVSGLRELLDGLIMFVPPLVMAALALPRRWVRLSLAQDSLETTWGLFRPPATWQRGPALSEYDRVTVRLVEHRPWGRRSAIFTSFSVGLESSRERVLIDDFRDRHHALHFGRQLARWLQRDLEDHLGAAPRLTSSHDVQRPLVERLEPVPVGPPDGLRLAVSRSPHLTVTLPRRGLVAWDLPWLVVLLCAAALSFLCWFSLPFLESHFGAVLSAGLASLATFLALLRALLRRTTARAAITVSPDGVAVCLTGWTGSEQHASGLGSIEDLDLRELPDERALSLVLETPARALVLAEGLPEAELAWAHAALREELRRLARPA